MPTERIQNDSAESLASKEWKDGERPLGRGLAACLDTLRKKKELGGIKAFGRTKDEIGNTDLQYFDTAGRVLTKKQAFRQQCYSIHNQKPSQNKIKKLKDQEDALLKEKKLDPIKGSESFKVAKNIMQKTKNPYVVISNL